MMLEAAGVHQTTAGTILPGDRDQSAIRITSSRGNTVGDARTWTELVISQRFETSIRLSIVVIDEQRRGIELFGLQRHGV